VTKRLFGIAQHRVDAVVSVGDNVVNTARKSLNNMLTAPAPVVQNGDAKQRSKPKKTQWSFAPEQSKKAYLTNLNERKRVKSDCPNNIKKGDPDSTDIFTRGTYLGIAILGDLFRRLLLRNRHKFKLQFNLQQFTLVVNVVRRKSVTMSCAHKADVQNAQIMSPLYNRLTPSSSCSSISSISSLSDECMCPIGNQDGTNSAVDGNFLTTLSISVEIKIVLDSQGHNINNNNPNPKCITQWAVNNLS